MTNDSKPQVRLILSDNEGLGQVSVDLDAFFEFSFWLAEELQDLVAQQGQFVRARARQDRSRPRAR